MSYDEEYVRELQEETKKLIDTLELLRHHWGENYYKLTINRVLRDYREWADSHEED